MQRIQQGLIPPGTEVDLTEVLVSSPLAADGFFVSDGRAGAHAGLWVQLEEGVQPPALMMGTLLNIQGMVAEVAEGDLDGLPTTQTRTQLNVTQAEQIEPMEAGDLPNPLELSLGELAIPDIAELYEGVLISIRGVTVTRAGGDGAIVLNGLLPVDTTFVPAIDEWIVRGAEFESIVGILDFSQGSFRLRPRIDADMPQPPASLGGCFPIGETYGLCTDGRPWRRAQDECAIRGARLVVLETNEENVALGELVAPWFRQGFWIGLTDRETEGEFIWHDGTELTYSGWSPGEPNDANGEDCTESNWRGPGTWNDARCGGRKPYVCEYTSGVPRCERDDQCGEGQCSEGLCEMSEQD